MSMSMGASNNQATLSSVFRADEDDLIDELLSLLKRERWENLKMHYEAGNLSAERTDLQTMEHDGAAEEDAITYALYASWYARDKEVELMLSVDEVEHDWTAPKCKELGHKIMKELSSRIPLAIEQSFEPDRRIADGQISGANDTEFGGAAAESG